MLCEKPVTLNAADAAELHAVARQNNRFFLHGVWSRFFPAYRELAQMVRDGDLGEIRSVNVAFGFNNDAEQTPRLQLPSLGGGALLDRHLHRAARVARLRRVNPSPHASGGLNQHGVDKTVSISMTPYGGDPHGGVFGGIISIGCEMQRGHHLRHKGLRPPARAFWSCTKMKWRRASTGGSTRRRPRWLRGTRRGRPRRGATASTARSTTCQASRVPAGTQLNYSNSMGFTYEVAAVMRALRQGKLECDEFSTEESLRVMLTLDACREQLGVVYPDEMPASAKRD